MSLLHEKLPADSCLKDGQQCWQFFNCYKVLCDAHGKEENDCWLRAQTHCTSYIYDDFFGKLTSCLSCEYFKQKGSQHPKGFKHFFTEQLRNINRKAFEQQFQEAESFTEILNRIPDGLFTFDRDWRINYFNPTAEKITGFCAEDALGMYCDDVFKITGVNSGYSLRQIVVKGLDIQNQEFEIIDVAGRNIPVICSTSAFRGAEGELLGGLEIFKDISELKVLEREVAKREKKFRRIFEGSNDTIYISTLDGDILDVNPAGVEMLGYPNKEELLKAGQANKLYKNKSDREKFVSLMSRDGSVKDFEVEFRRIDGAPIHTLVSSRQYENPETGVIEFEGTIKDITRRKNAEEIIQQRNRELSVLNSIAVALNFTLGLENLLKIALEKITKNLSVGKGGIFLFDDDGHEPTLQVGVGIPQATKDQPARIEFMDAMLLEYLVEKKTELEPEAFFPSFQVSYSVGNVPVIWLTCHLITSKRKTVGFLGFESSKAQFLSTQELHLLGSLCNLLGNAIENAKLVEMISQHENELRRLTKKMFETQELERNRIARELHDEAGQSLTAVKLCLGRLEEKVQIKNMGLHDDFKEIKNMLGRTSSEIRRLSYNLHPTMLNDLGLEPALRLYFNEIQAHSDLDIHFDMVGFEERMEANLETALYRISQEALNNTLKHSGAEIFKCKIIEGYTKLIYIVEDDGVGFQGSVKKEDPRNLGIIGMRERVVLLGGTFQLKGNPGKGVRIRIEIPLLNKME